MEMIVEFGELPAPAWTFLTFIAAQTAAIVDEALIGGYATAQDRGVLLKLRALAPAQRAKVVNVRWQFANARERQRFGEQTAQASDVGGFAIQTDDGTLWQLVTVREQRSMPAMPGTLTARASWASHGGDMQRAAIEARRAQGSAA